MSEVLKDPERQKRLGEVFGHLFAHHGISTQGAFAGALHIQRTALSAAMNGNKSYLTNNLFMKICAAFPGMFNLDYLLSGEGSLLTTEESMVNNTLQHSHREPSGIIDQSSLMNATLAAQQQTIESLNREIKSLHERLKEKDEYIANLKKQLSRYEHEKILDNYPFPMSVSEPLPEQKKR